ncbi:DUF742 domain-containing protein [Streptomyces sp. NPDC028635]|uniref:DUF742 domain-containing protein n=1 Tax=Streptomyces sp. NPDC028635 TaxID=3154800 RepID=UPI0033EF3341
MTPPQRQRRQRKEPSPSVLPPRPAQQEGDKKAPERLYIITGAEGDRAKLDLVTLIVAHADPPSSATPEQTAVLRLCAAPLSVAELSAYLQLPFSAMTALLTEMLAAELVHARAPIVRQQLPDRSLLEAVMHGLERL